MQVSTGKERRFQSHKVARSVYFEPDPAAWPPDFEHFLVTFVTLQSEFRHIARVSPHIRLGTGSGEIMRLPDKRKREKVVAEITLAHLTQIARETGRTLTDEEAIDFLNRHGRAYAMWTRMMQAGEEYIKSALQQQTPVPVPRSPTGRRRLAM